MDIASILRRSWTLTKEHRFLWWLGVLAAFTSGGAGFSGGGTNWHQQTTTSTHNAINTATNWVTHHLPLIGILALIFFVLWLGVLYLSFAANAGLIESIDSLETSNKALGFGPAFHSGRSYVWRLVGVALFSIGIILGTMLGIGVPIVALVAISFVLLPLLILSIPLAILAFIGFILLAVYVGVVANLAQRFVVLENQRVFEAFGNAHRLAWRFRPQVLLLFLANVGVSILVGISIAIAFGVAAVALFGIGIAVYAIAHILGVLIYCIVVGLFAFVTFLAISGITTAFFSSYWTIGFRALRYVQNQTK